MIAPAMTWTAAEFLDLLEHRGIMAADHIDDLREQLAAVEGGVHAVHVARKLVDAGYLNPYFAKTLLEEGYRSRRGAGKSPQPKGSPAKRADEELDLAPLEEDELEERAALAKGPPINLRIELPPLHDPDAWPSATEPPGPHAAETPMSMLPAANPRSGYGALKQIEADSRIRRRPQADTAWLIWALGGAAAVLALIVAMLLVWR